MKKIDMSEAAVLRRLKQVDQLRELCLSLMKAKRLHDEKQKVGADRIGGVTFVLNREHDDQIT